MDRGYLKNELTIIYIYTIVLSKKKILTIIYCSKHNNNCK